MFILLQIYRTHLFQKQKIRHSPKVVEIRPKAEWLGEGVGRWPLRPGREREARDGQRPKATPHGVTWAPLPAVACAVGPAITSLFRPAQPDRPWCAPDQLPPDARRAADGKPAPSCLCLRGVFGGCFSACIHSCFDTTYPKAVSPTRP